MIDLLGSLVGQEVIVMSDQGLRTEGKLVGFRPSLKGLNHRPSVLVLQSPDGFILCRDWCCVAVGRRR